jgi:aminoglycoside phosphotransferase (APT) family kinase protein
LPDGLIDTIPDYLGSYRPAPACLVHGDLTEDHIYIRGEHLEGVIDWGGALTTDPFYDLGALHLGRSPLTDDSSARSSGGTDGRSTLPSAIRPSNPISCMSSTYSARSATWPQVHAHLPELARALWSPEE